MEQQHHNEHGVVFNKGQRHDQNTSPENIPVSRGVSFLIRKGEKLTTALYMVTEIIPERDPMKWKVREIGVDVLSDITVAAHSSSAERMSVFRAVIRKIERVVSFLEIAQTSQMMSEMNSSILRKEYLGFKDAIEAEWHHIYDDSKRLLAKSVVEEREVTHTTPLVSQVEDLLITTQTEEKVVMTPVVQSAAIPSVKETVPPQSSIAPRFSIKNALEKAEEVLVEDASKQKDETKEEKEVEVEIVAPKHVVVAAHSVPRHEETRIHVERLNKQSVRPEILTTRPAPVSSQERSIPSRPTPNTMRTERMVPAIIERPRPRLVDVHEDGTAGFGRARSEGDRDDRRKIILALIKQKPSLTVKDIVKSIPHVSEKTIQRELLAMVAEGILLKKGERRWSTYSLND